MTASTSYGQAFGRRLGAQSWGYASRALRNAMLAVTELQYDSPEGVLSTPPADEDAFVVALHMKYFPKYEYWENDRAAPVSSLLPGQIIIYDIKRTPIFHLNDPFHSIHYYFPRAALNAVADEAEVPRISELHYRAGVCMDDPVVRDLTSTLLPLFANPANVPRLFMDSVLVGVAHHVACRYGGMRLQPVRTGLGLSKWQEMRAKDLIAASLDGDLPLAALASECGMSMRQFLKAFRTSVGATPHQWLARRRIEMAQILLREKELPIQAIARCCGFSDQSHLTRVFTATTGTSPAAWRRGHGK